MVTPALRRNLAAINIALGIWLFVSPFVLGIDGAGQWHLYFWGVVVAILGASQVARAQSGQGSIPGAAIGVAFIGFWVALSPLFYDYAPLATWNNVVFGILLLVSGAYETMQANRTTRPSHA